MGRVTLATPLLGWFIIRQLGLVIVYLCANVNNSSFSHSRDIIGTAKFKMGHMTLTMPLLRVICHPYAGT